jgi:ATP-dependent DNA helicase RecG
VALPDQELIALLTDLESDRVERKESAVNSDRLSEAICAFANDMPGYGEPGVLFVGVSDNGAVLGRPVTDELLRHLADLRDQGTILPPPTMTVRKLRLDGGEVAVVEVRPSMTPPVRFKGRVYIRRLNERRRSLDLPFDSRPIPGSSLTDLDTYAFTAVLLPALLPRDVLAENERNTEQRLAALRLTSQDSVPTAAGVLALGIDPLALDGTLLDVLRQLDELLELNITTAIDFTSSRQEERKADYPLVALQQVARNAVMHRSYEHTTSPVRITWYSDRIEIISPGGPYGIVSVDNFGHPGVTDYRNPALADLLRGLGYVQRFGMGLPSTRRSLERNGNAAPEFKVTDAYVSVTIRRRP